MSGPSIVSNKTGWGSCTCVPGEMIADGFRGCLGVCFMRRAARTVSTVVGEELDLTWLSKSSGCPLLSFDISRSAALHHELGKSSSSLLDRFPLMVGPSRK